MKPFSKKSLRLPGFDYSTLGAYFVTLSIKRQPMPLSQIRDDQIHLTALGRMVDQEWQKTGVINPDLELDTYVVMPDHFHAILWIKNQVRLMPDYHRLPQTPGYRSTFGGSNARLFQAVGYFKGMVTRKVNKQSLGFFQWQRRFHDRIIRNEKELLRIRQYIRNNPQNWTR